MNVWPKDVVQWQDGETGCLSVPFTWLLPKAKAMLLQGDLFARQWLVGGPAVRLMPKYLEGLPGVTIGTDSPGVLQRVNPQATRTTVGCPRRCSFCGVRQIEGEFRELPDWPDLPVVCDNNLLVATDQHFVRVIDRLVTWGWCDFNQGLDARLMTGWHASQIVRIKRPMVRLAIDADRDRDQWRAAVDMLIGAGVAKSRIRSYVLCGFGSLPGEDWDRCEFVESAGIKALPMWYHHLDAMEYGDVTVRQRDLGWTKAKQRQLMRWYYKHSGTKLVESSA